MVKLRNLIRWATVDKAGADDKKRPIQKVSLHGTHPNVAVCMPYGLHANIPEGFMGVLLAFEGDNANRGFFPLSWLKRPKKTPRGDVILFQPLIGAGAAGTQIGLRANGDVDIWTKGNHVEVIGGTLQITAAGSVTLTAPDVTLTAAEVTATGNVTIDGDLQVDGELAVESGVVAANGQDIGESHTHTGSPTAGAGPVSTTGTPNS